MIMDKKNQDLRDRVTAALLALAISTTILLGSLSPAGATLGPA
jgi:hypothetical protein